MAEGTFHIQAHRGASSDYIENTLPAFARAIEVGASSVELDIHMTQDGVVVVYHDFTLDPAFCRYRNGNPITSKVAIRNLTYKTLMGIVCLDKKRLKDPNREITEEEKKIPTLEEVFKLFNESKNPNAKKMWVDVEVKSELEHPEWSPSPEVFAKTVNDMILKNRNFQNTVVRSFDHRVLLEIKKINSKVRLAVLTLPEFTDYLKVVDELKPEIMAPNVKAVSKELVDSMHKKGVKVIPWTVNSLDAMGELIHFGVDGITSDNPDDKIQYLEKLGIRNLPLSEFKEVFCKNVLPKVKK